MRLSDLSEEVSFSLIANKSRSFLTILGIVIGIASVIAMISIGQGSQSAITNSIQSLGSNLISVTPGSQRNFGFGANQGRGSAQTLKNSDATAIADQVANVKSVAPAYSTRYQVTLKGANTNTAVLGTTPEYADIRNVSMDKGSFFTSEDVSSKAKVAVLGPTVVTDIFGEDYTDDPTGTIIKINKIEFTIIGVAKSKGGTGFNNQDDIVYIPLDTMQKSLSGTKYLSNISIQATKADAMTQVQEDITALLIELHKVTTADFSVQNQNDLMSTATSTSKTMTILLASVAAISLIVGGIGIMNMMLTNVTERTREIGLRKAIGAKRRDINTQFLAEAVTLTFLGGVIGIVLGVAVSLVINYFGWMTTTITPYSIFLAFGVSALIGVVFGYYPAKGAAAMNPIEALRYE
ncbi:MAG TPA: ABC transporter permease [Patescibacteria group bacterium]|nr:ABC transporter permease [Patescibacteria group bacterium]